MEFSLINIFGNIMSFSGAINVKEASYLFMIRVQSENKEIIESLITHVVDDGNRKMVLPLPKGGIYNDVEEAIHEKFVLGYVGV